MYSFGLPLGEVAQLAAEAEDIGFSAMWFTESRHNPLLAAAVSALTTEQLLLGTAILVAFPRSPMVTAQATWDLAAASKGRFVLGLGPQVKAHIEKRFSVPYSHPGPRLKEYIASLRAIWRAFQGEERLRFKGDFYSFSLLTDFFSPGPIDYPNIPIYISAVNTGMARIAGEVCDGIHVHPLHSVKYLEEVMKPAVAAGAAAAGRSPDEIVLSTPVFMIVGDTDEEVEAQRSSVRRQIGFYGSTRTYAPVFECHGWDDTPSQLHALMAKGDLDAMEQVITDEMLDVFAVSSTWDRLGHDLVARYKGVVPRLCTYGNLGDWHAKPELAERFRAVASVVRNG